MAARPVARTRRPAARRRGPRRPRYDSARAPRRPPRAPRAAARRASPAADFDHGSREAPGRAASGRPAAGGPPPRAPAAGPPPAGAGWSSRSAPIRPGPPPSARRRRGTGRGSRPARPGRRRSRRAGGGRPSRRGPRTGRVRPARQVGGRGDADLGERLADDPEPTVLRRRLPQREGEGAAGRQHAGELGRRRVGAGRWLRTKPPTHASKAPSAKGSATASASTKARPGWRLRASASIPGDTSAPVGRAPRSAARPHTTPGPQPRSRTRVPGRRRRRRAAARRG